MKIGVVGLGKMGLAMAQRLAGQGLDVSGWDIDRAKRGALGQIGIAWADDPAALAEGSDTVVSIVTDDAAVEWLFGSTRGLLAGDASGKLFIEMSTLRPATVRATGQKVEQAGARLVSAPVMGSIPTVREGKLLVLAGGEAEDIARAGPVFSALARKVVHLGSLGSSSAMKLVVNLTMAAYLEALAEGLALGERQGLALDQMLEVLGEAPTANPWLAAKLATLAGGTSPTTLDLDALRKDVLSAVATGSIDGVAMPLASGVLSSLSAASAAGYGAEDLAQLPAFFRRHMVRRAGASADRQT